MSDAEKREHTCPFEEYVRRSTGEIVVNISRGLFSAGLSGLIGRKGFVSVSDAEKKETAILLRSVFAV